MQSDGLESATADDDVLLPKFGAAKSISSTIDELARQASRLTEGETILELDPSLVDASFVQDRISIEDDEAYSELLEAVRNRGQDTPILVRPHPDTSGRFMVVFGHRRLRVARELARPIRAVVKSLADIDHVVAQGQENSARANLSFIEKVLFAQHLEDRGFTKETIQSALTVDYQTLSKMGTISKAIPQSLLDAIGPAKTVGRDRWLEFRKLVENPRNLAKAQAYAATDEFANADQDERFGLIFAALNSTGKTVRKSVRQNEAEPWSPQDKSVSAAVKKAGKGITISFKDKDSGHFGVWISENLDGLYEAFRRSKQGD